MFDASGGVDPVQGPSPSNPDPGEVPSSGGDMTTDEFKKALANSNDSSLGGPSDSSPASTNFFPDMPMSKDEFKQFMNGLLKMITAEIQNERDKMKAASDELKKSENGEDN